MRRLVLVLAALLQVLLIVFWALAALASMISIQITPSQPPPPPNPAILPLTSWFVINVVSLVAFVTRHRGWGYWIMVIVQAINVVVVTVVNKAVRIEDSGVVVLVAVSACALVAVIMLLAARYENVLGPGGR